jgi:hypothetical protein
VGRTLACIVLFSAAVFSNPEGPVFTRRDKAFFAEPNVVNFVRPGLALTITNASVAADGTMTVSFTVADPQGLPLDVQGINTPGAIATSFLASYIPKGATDYVAITSRAATGAVSGAIRQPATDAGGTLTPTGNGQYTYTGKENRRQKRMP